MQVQPNLVLGVVGLLIALGSGSYIAYDWKDLSNLEDWAATFETHAVVLPERAAAVPTSSQRTETYRVADQNLTRIDIDLSWVDPVFGNPEVRLVVKDPRGTVRADERHTGGVSGIHLDLELIGKADVPTGTHPFKARPSTEDDAFATRWPAHPEARGDWTLLIDVASPQAGAAGAINYNVRFAYEYYTGVFEASNSAVR